MNFRGASRARLVIPHFQSLGLIKLTLYTYVDVDLLTLTLNRKEYKHFFFSKHQIFSLTTQPGYTKNLLFFTDNTDVLQQQPKMSVCDNLQIRQVLSLIPKVVQSECLFVFGSARAILLQSLLSIYVSEAHLPSCQQSSRTN